MLLLAIAFLSEARHGACLRFCYLYTSEGSADLKLVATRCFPARLTWFSFEPISGALATPSHHPIFHEAPTVVFTAAGRLP